MTRLSSTASTCAAQRKMWLIQVFTVIYFTAICAAEDPEDATDDYRTIAVTPVPTIKPPVPSLQLQSAWLDVFPSEEVELRCSINSSSGWTFDWFRNGVKVQDSDKNVFFSEDRSVLTITAETQMSSGSYYCQGVHRAMNPTPQSQSLEVKVYASKPKPTVTRNLKYDKLYCTESIDFTCSVSEASGWKYLWYHNGVEIQGHNTATYSIKSVDHPDSGLYHCEAKRQDKNTFVTEKSEPTTLQVSELPTPSLKQLSPWLDVFKDERVEFGCEVDGSDWTYDWYRNGELISKDELVDNLEQDLDGDGSTFNITNVNKADEGAYKCRAKHKDRNVLSGFSNNRTVTLYGRAPKSTVSKSPNFDPMYVGETVNFTCEVDLSSGWNYQWYKDGSDLPFDVKTISFMVSAGGKYSCQATRGEKTTTGRSAEIPQNVHEIPVPSLKQKTQWLDVFPTESVKLSCEMKSGSDWTYTWYKDNLVVRADDTVSFDSNGATLSISSASTKHAGQYNCEGHLKDRSISSNSSSELTLKVYNQKPSVTLTQDPPYEVMFSGESVSFTSHINVSSGWEYQWFKDGVQLKVSENTYSINSINAAHSGSYKCSARRGVDPSFSTESIKVISLEVKEKKPKPLLTQEPNVDKLYTGEAVSFQCKVEISSGWEYFWYKNGTELTQKGSSFKIQVANWPNKETYECSARRGKSNYHTEHSDKRILQISEIPVPSLRPKTQWLDVFPTERVNLNCGVEGSSDWAYTWYKDEQEVWADDTVSFELEGAILSIRSASAKHAGLYNCMGKLKDRPVYSKASSVQTLTVYDAKPSVTLMQNPKHDEMHTEDAVSLSCHIDVSSGWEYLWYKDGKQLIASGNNHNITSAVTTDSGSYTCKVKRGMTPPFESDHSEAVRLSVEERPQAHIELLTGWSEVFSTDSLVLRCEVKGTAVMWNYTWFKEGQQVSQTPSERYTVTPHNDPEQSLYTCSGNRTGRPSYSRQSDSYKTKNLLLKRRVLLSISGCLFFGLVVVFLGCIFLKVFRKPADDEDKPEAENLFLTMAQLKDHTDPPCLVEYFTEADLKAPAKDGDENGTVCSETTPLPITTQEDQAVTTESHDKEENNGGLVSFKQ